MFLPIANPCLYFEAIRSLESSLMSAWGPVTLSPATLRVGSVSLRNIQTFISFYSVEYNFAITVHMIDVTLQENTMAKDQFIGIG